MRVHERTIQRYGNIAFGLRDLGFGFQELGSVSRIELEDSKHKNKNAPLVERDEKVIPSNVMSVDYSLHACASGSLTISRIWPLHSSR